MNTIADRLALALLESGLSVADVIKRGGPSRPTIYRIQNDQDYLPEDYTINRLAEALGISFEWLRSGVGPKFVPPFKTKEDIKTFMAGGAPEDPVSYRLEPRVNIGLLQLAIAEALRSAPGADPRRLAEAITDAYTLASRPGREDSVEALVRKLLQ